VPGCLPDLPGVREDLSRYMGEIEHMDHDFQRVLEHRQRGVRAWRTPQSFAGDNGMAFPSGKGSLHDPGLNVPPARVVAGHHQTRWRIKHPDLG